MDQDTDAALMLAFQRGDESAFRVLYERHARAMVGYCHRFVKDAARAEELAQDVFLKLYRAAHRYAPSARFKTFLYRVATNHCLNELRRGEYAAQPASPGLARRDGERNQGAGERDAAPDLDALPSQDPSPHQALEAERLAGAVVRLLDGLPAQQRAAFVLCRFEGMSYQDIAETLETSVSAVKSLVHRATVAAAAGLAPFAPGAPQEMEP
jgi:RNA polymerase sigma-70 factor (ECF subfamily)